MFRMLAKAKLSAYIVNESTKQSGLAIVKFLDDSSKIAHNCTTNDVYKVFFLIKMFVCIVLYN